MMRRVIVPLLILIVLVAIGIAATCASSSDAPSTPGATVAPVQNTPIPSDFATVVAPEATYVGRSDCARGWLAYSDPQNRYSICYPPDFEVTASDQALNAHNPMPSDSLDTRISVIVSWVPTPGTVYYPPSPENCGQYTVIGHTSSIFLELTVAGRTVPTCLSQGVSLEGREPLPIGNLQGWIPLAEDGSDVEGFIEFAVGFTGRDVSQLPTLGKAVIDTLVVNFR